MQAFAIIRRGCSFCEDAQHWANKVDRSLSLVKSVCACCQHFGSAVEKGSLAELEAATKSLQGSTQHGQVLCDFVLQQVRGVVDKIMDAFARYCIAQFKTVILPLVDGAAFQ